MATVGIDIRAIEGVRERLTLSDAIHLGAKLGLPKAGSWVKFEKALLNEAAIHPDRAKEIDLALAKLFRSTITTGDRALTLFRVSPARANDIINAIAKSGPESSPYLPSYPYPLPVSALKPLTEDLFLSEVVQGTDHALLVFSGRRLIEDRLEQNAAAVDSAMLKKIGWSEYDEFVLVKRRQVQTYEIVRIDASQGLVELRVEEHQGVRSTESLQQLQNKLNSLLASVGLPLLTDSVNLFPAIKSIYDDPKEGIVVELGFTTATGSAKHEKMRAHRKDLRTELFHVGGKKAVNGVLSPFRVAVRWQDKGGAIEELMLPGSMRQLAKGPSASLDHALVFGLLEEDAIRRCVRRLEKHL